jgi:hypothetical protein
MFPEKALDIVALIWNYWRTLFWMVPEKAPDIMAFSLKCLKHKSQFSRNTTQIPITSIYVLCQKHKIHPTPSHCISKKFPIVPNVPLQNPTNNLPPFSLPPP